ncbi:agmatinase family protein [Bacillus sp. A301a_S52]|jgi:agmatinase|nr:agmatinase family protein [Bacillus sp. A301a_S52]
MNVDKNKVVEDKDTQWLSECWNKKNQSDIQFGFLQIPFDHAVSHRPGTRIGPSSILEVLKSYSLYCADKRVSLESCNFMDLGSVDIVHSFSETYSNIENSVLQVNKETLPIFLGGDHSITDPIFRGFIKRSRKKLNKIGLILFDSHFDYREPRKGKEHSGHWLKTLEDVIDYANLAIIGVNAPIYSEKYLNELESKGSLIFTSYDVRRLGREQVIQQVLKHLKKCEEIYISVDIDAIDQAFAPGTSVPNSNGLYPFEVFDSLFEIARTAPVGGLDVVEVSPWFDQNANFTPQVAAQIIFNFMAGIAQKQKDGKININNSTFAHIKR